ncbi:flagellar basal body rod protein FlgC [Parasalinivibrio latis]|uniref:flagellar basal body rod protein FlgC n=1 Tax=Parasalinivibrio latis TaxID=2952610 RepID=UPI0030E50AA7
MSFYNIYDIAGSAMLAQTVRLNTVASNLANADVASGSEKTGYHAKYPVFETVMTETNGAMPSAMVRIDGIEESKEPLIRRYDPQHPKADKDGYVFYADVNPVEEMADMMEASRNFETNVDVMTRARSMQQSILRLGQTS